MKLFGHVIVAVATAVACGCASQPVTHDNEKEQVDDKLLIDVDHRRLPTFLSVQPARPIVRTVAMSAADGDVVWLVAVIIGYNCKSSAGAIKVCDTRERRFSQPLARNNAPQTVAVQAVSGWLVYLNGKWPNSVDHFLFEFSRDLVRCRLGKNDREPDWLCESVDCTADKFVDNNSAAACIRRVRASFLLVNSLHSLLCLAPNKAQPG